MQLWWNGAASHDTPAEQGLGAGVFAPAEMSLFWVKITGADVSMD